MTLRECIELQVDVSGEIECHLPIDGPQDQPSVIIDDLEDYLDTIPGRPVSIQAIIDRGPVLRQRQRELIDRQLAETQRHPPAELEAILAKLRKP